MQRLRLLILVVCGVGGAAVAVDPTPLRLKAVGVNFGLHADGGTSVWFNDCCLSWISYGSWAEDAGTYVLTAGPDRPFFGPALGRSRPFNSAALVVADGGWVLRGEVAHWRDLSGRLASKAGEPFETVLHPGWSCTICGALGPTEGEECEGDEIPEAVLLRQEGADARSAARRDGGI